MWLYHLAYRLSWNLQNQRSLDGNELISNLAEQQLSSQWLPMTGRQAGRLWASLGACVEFSPVGVLPIDSKE